MRTLLWASLAALTLTASPALGGDGILGVYLTEDTRAMNGALIEEVAPNSPASDANLRKGDRIVKANGKAIRNSDEFIKILVNGNAGDVLTLRVNRDGWEKTMKITLAPKRGTPQPKPKASKAPPAERGFLGIYLRQNDGGAPVVDGVMDGSPAAKGGLKVGDTILSVSGTKVSDPAGLITSLAQYGPGAKVAFGIKRRGKDQTLNVTLGRRPAERVAPAPPAQAAQPKPTPKASEGKKPYIGVALVDNGGKGPLEVDDVAAGSPAERFGLRPKDVIISANGKPLKSIEDFVGLMQGLNAGDSVLFKIERDGWKSDVRLTLGARG
jgi:S1-C subfamily serine protease